MERPSGSLEQQTPPGIDNSTPEEIAIMGRIVGMRANPAARVLVLEVEYPISIGRTRKVIMPYAQLCLTAGQFLEQMGEQELQALGGRVIG